MRVSTIEWPATLGCPLRANYRATLKNRNLRSSVEDGAAQYARFFYEDYRIFGLSFAWKQNQILIWETFFETALHHGMRWFMIPNVAVDGTIRNLYSHVNSEITLSGRGDSVEYYSVTLEVEAFVYHDA